MNESKCKVYPDGTKRWLHNGKLHREGGPAVEWADGSTEWWLNGSPHREGGPAIEWVDESKLWYLNGVEYETPDEMPLSLFLAYVKWMRDNSKCSSK